MVFKRKPKNVGDNHTLFLHNYLSKELQRYFRPFNFLQYVMLCPKYRIKDDFVFPNGWIALTFTFLGTLSNIWTNYGKACEGFNIRNSNPTNLKMIIDYCIFFSYLIYIIGYITNFVVNFRNRDNNVALVLKFQQISNVVVKKSKCYKRNVFYNNCLNIFIIVQYVLFSFCMDQLVDDAHKHDYVSDLLLMNFNLNILYAIRVIVLLQNYALSIMELLQAKGLDIRSNEIHCTRIFQAYKDLIDSYSLFIVVFQDLIIFFVFETFGHSLSYLETTLTMFQIDFTKDASEMQGNLIKTSVMFLIFVGWLGRNLLVVLVLGIEMEKFYVILEDVQAQCDVCMEANDCAVMNRRMFKNMRRLYRSHFSKASARGVFHIDGTLHLELTSVITSYVIVILQFTFTNA